MENKVKNDYVLRFLLVTFVLFLIIYITSSNKIIEYKYFERTRLTEERIKKFEKDINDGKNVSIEDYSIYNYEDYSTPLTKVGNEISVFIEKTMNIGIKKTLKTLSELFYK